MTRPYKYALEHTDMNELTAYSNYLLMRCQIAGCFGFGDRNLEAERARLCEEARNTADKIKGLICRCKDYEVAGLLEPYDLLYRAGHGKASASEYILNQQSRIFNAWERGDSNIDESVIARMLQNKVLVSRSTIPPEQLKAYSSLVDEWTETLRLHSYFPKATAYENYQRLAVLMTARLGIDDEETLKREWFAHNRIDDYTSAGTKILESYRLFCRMLPPYIMSFEESIIEDNIILGELAERSDIHPLQREAYMLAIEYNRQFFG